MKILILFILPALLLTQALGASIETIKKALDPDNFVTIGDNSYYISSANELFTQSQAIILCYDDGMKLLSLKTEEKWLEIKTYLEENDGETGYWTSGYKINADTWIWSNTDEEFTYTAWSMLTDEPNATGNDICVFIRGNYDWFDEPCSETTRPFICEFDNVMK